MKRQHMARYFLGCLRIALLALLSLCLLLTSEAHAIPKLNLQIGPSSTGVSLPAGFAVTLITSGLNHPTDMAFLPSGDLLVTEKGQGVDIDGVARVRYIQDGVLQPEPVIELSANVFGEAGLLSIVIDPEFTSSHYFYVWYSTGKKALKWSGVSENRLSRFTFDPSSGTAPKSSELIMYGDIPSGKYHNGGGMTFASDGSILIAVGDTTVWYEAQDMKSLVGKVLRLKLTNSGAIVPSDNPYVSDPNVLNEIYAAGLRSPWRMTKRRSDGEIFIADVGLIHWEELNQLKPKANYGWDERQGPCPNGYVLPCEAAPSKFTDPVMYYVHERPDVQGSAITGIAFYEGDGFPEGYRGNLFFSDFNNSYISVARLPKSGGFTISPFATNVSGIVDLEYFNDSLYYLNFYTGKLAVIFYQGGDNTIPVALLAADQTVGKPPLTVQFSAQGSYDVDDNVLNYTWDFGDGTAPVTNRKPFISHTYASDGTYAVTLTIKDVRGGESDPASLKIAVYSGELPEIVMTNLVDGGRTLYYGGDSWLYQAKRLGGTEDLDANAPYTWSIDLAHNQHVHPVISSKVTFSDTFHINRDNHGGDWNVWYRFRLVMKTDTGQEIEVARDLLPQFTTLSVDSVPAGAVTELNGVERSGLHHAKAIVGTENALEAAPSVRTTDAISVFSHWQIYEGGLPEHSTDVADDSWDKRATMVTAPKQNTGYVAIYNFSEPVYSLWLPLIVK